MSARNVWGQVLHADDVEPFAYDAQRDEAAEGEPAGHAPLVVTDGVRDLMARARENRGGYVVLRDGRDGVACFDAARALVAYRALHPLPARFSAGAHVYRLTPVTGREIAALLGD